MTDPNAPPPIDPTPPEIDPGGAPPEINDPVTPAETPPLAPPVGPGDERPYG